MKLLAAGLMLVGGVALAMGNLDLWTNADEPSFQYSGSWLGGELTIDSVENEVDPGLLQLRIKMTGAGSIPEGQSEYYVTDVEQGAALPVEFSLTKTNSEWTPDRRQNPRRNGKVDIEVGDRSELSGVLQTYPFSTSAIQISE